MTRTVLVVSAFAIMSVLAPEPPAGSATIVMRCGCSDDPSTPRLPDATAATQFRRQYGDAERGTAPGGVVHVIDVLAPAGREVVGVNNRERSLDLHCACPRYRRVRAGRRRERLDVVDREMGPGVLAAQFDARAVLKRVRAWARQQDRGPIIALQPVIASRRVFDAILDDQLFHRAGDDLDGRRRRCNDRTVLGRVGLRRQRDEQRQQRSQSQRSIEYAVFIYDCTVGRLLRMG